jgi:hypothetical protein
MPEHCCANAYTVLRRDRTGGESSACLRRDIVPELTFRIKKRRDADALLVLVREDGSTTTNSIGRPDGYGPVHDLCHYVIESTLGLSEGFLGLVASGWEISDFEVKGTVRRLPVEAFLAECAAGELSRQAMMWQYSSAEDFVWAVKTVMRWIYSCLWMSRPSSAASCPRC